MGQAVAIAVAVLVLSACHSKPSTPVNASGSLEGDMTDIVASSRERIRVLMAPERARVALEPATAATSAEALGALDVMAFESAEPVAHVAIYVFDHQRQHAAAVGALMATVEPEGRRILHASNGPMLFFGHIRMDGPDPHTAKYRLSYLVSAFAGDE